MWLADALLRNHYVNAACIIPVRLGLLCSSRRKRMSYCVIDGLVVMLLESGHVNIL